MCSISTSKSLLLSNSIGPNIVLLCYTKMHPLTLCLRLKCYDCDVDSLLSTCYQQNGGQKSKNNSVKHALLKANADVWEKLGLITECENNIISGFATRKQCHTVRYVTSSVKKTCQKLKNHSSCCNS